MVLLALTALATTRQRFHLQQGSQYNTNRNHTLQVKRNHRRDAPPITGSARNRPTAGGDEGDGQCADKSVH